LKDLYYDQFSQLLDTAVKNSVISTWQTKWFVL
jgi:hypothetical protein